MKILVIKINLMLNDLQKDTAKRDILEMVDKGVLILDDFYDYEVVDNLVILKGG